MERTASDRSQTAAPNFNEKLQAEAELFSGAKYLDGIGHSLESMGKAPLKTAAELGFGIAIGAGLTLLEKNPAPLAATSIKYLNAAFVGAFGYDVAMRVGDPAVSVWNNPNSVAENQKKLGDNLGEFTTNIGLSVVGGFATEGFADKIAKTKVGSFIQGYSERTVNLKDLDPANQALFKKMFEKPSAAGAETKPTNANANQTITFKEFKDGTRVGITAEKMTVANAEGLTYSFERDKPKFLGLDSGMKLTQLQDNVKPGSSLDMLIKSGRLTDLADTIATSHTVANGVNTRSFESGAGRIDIKTDAAKSVREIDSLGDAIKQNANGRWSYLAKDAGADASAGTTIDLSKLARSPFSLNSYLSAAFYQTVLKEYVNPRVLDMGSDKVSHLLLLDHLIPGSSDSKDAVEKTSK